MQPVQHPAVEHPEQQHLVIFGASGAIGGAVVEAATTSGWQVTAVSRNPTAQPKLDHAAPGIRSITADPLLTGFQTGQLAPSTPYTSACWAQGSNLNDSVYTVDLAAHRAIYESNCTYILITLQALLQGAFLAAGSRLCIVSSVWQNLARPAKLSYCMSKVALQGLVHSASADLAGDGHLINAVLPGAIDTTMSRSQLTEEQFDRISLATAHQRLVRLKDVASLICYLCSPENTGITGQCIAADLGFSHVRIV